MSPPDNELNRSEFISKMTAAAGTLPPDQIERIFRTDKNRNPQNEFGAMNDVLAELHEITGDKKHLAAALLFNREWFMGPLAKGEKAGIYCAECRPGEWYFVSAALRGSPSAILRLLAAGRDRLIHFALSYSKSRQHPRNMKRNPNIADAVFGALRHRNQLLSLCFIVGGLTLTISSPAVAQNSDSGHASQSNTFIDYFLPTPIVGILTTNVWGASTVGPRDPKNGLEDETMKQWNYWDGEIIKAPDGKYHLFGSRWSQARGHNGWFGSQAVHAVSDNLIGPYVDKGLCWTNDAGGRGHNVGALTLPEGGYAVYVSETRPCEVYTSKSLDGPWDHIGTVTVEGEPRWHASNVKIMVRPDGKFEFTERNGGIFISDKGILGPYQRLANSVWPKGIPNLEDPCIWYSGGLFHILVNSWSTRKAYHLTSKDGIHDWTNRGLAYDPRENITRYADGTVNHWNKVERPSVYIEDGHVVALTLAGIDREKDQEKGNDQHGSKIIVIPFDGAALDRDLRSAAGSSKQRAAI